jgi:hypothetical protein
VGCRRGDRFELPELIVDADVGIADFPNFEASQASGIRWWASPGIASRRYMRRWKVVDSASVAMWNGRACSAWISSPRGFYF